MALAENIIAEKYENLALQMCADALLVTINRPKSLNALAPAVITELRTLFAKLLAEIGKEADWSVRGIVLTGVGEKAFIAGADIAQMSTMSPAAAEKYTKDAQELTDWFSQVPVPVIAAVNGYALGGGCEFALACDYIYASENAVFGQPEVSLGVIPGFGGTVRLQKVLSPAYAREMILTGKRINALEAKNLGLVNEIFATGVAAVEAAVASVMQAAKQSPHAVALAKRTAYEVQGLNVHKGLAAECAAFVSCFGTADMQEGMGAFLEKRKPEFIKKSN